MTVCIFFIFFAILEYSWILILMARATRTNSSTKITDSVIEEFIKNVSDEVKKIKSASGFWQKLCAAVTQTRLIDAMSSIIFPSSFLIFNLIYWFHMWEI